MAIAQVNLTVRALDADFVETNTLIIEIKPGDTGYTFAVGSPENVRYGRFLDNQTKEALRSEIHADELAQRLAQAVQGGDVQAALILADVVLERYRREAIPCST